jgi:hypothetical protein
MTTTSPATGLAPRHAARPGRTQAAARAVGSLVLASGFTTVVLLVLARFVEAGA